MQYLINRIVGSYLTRLFAPKPTVQVLTAQQKRAYYEAAAQRIASSIAE